MRVLIAGGGRTAAQLALLLLEQDHDVRLIESRPDTLVRMHRELPTETIYEGLPTDPAILEQAGIRNMQAVAAMTTSDADNLSLCFLVRTRYNVPRTIARINNPRNAWLFDSKFHVDVALNQAQILASLIQEEMSLGDMMTLLKLRRGQFLLVEEKIPPKAKVVGAAVRDLVLPEQSVITAILRHGEVVMPRGATVLEAGDEVLAVTDSRGAESLAKLLSEE